MDYCATETTLNTCEEVCEREMATSEIVREIRKELAETLSCLSSIRLSLEGTETPDKNTDEPKCFHDEVKLVERMAMDCMGLSHCISDKLFRSHH